LNFTSFGRSGRKTFKMACFLKDEQIKTLFLPEEADKGYIVFAKTKTGEEIQKGFNKAIKEIKLDYDSFLQHEFDLID